MATQAEKEIVTSFLDIPYAVFNTELSRTQQNNFNQEIAEIMRYYQIYKSGTDFTSEGSNSDYIPSDMKFKKVKNLIDKEARFLFSTPPTFTVNPNMSGSDQELENNTKMNDFLQDVLKKVKFNSDLVKAAKDCFIGKRVACMLNFNETEGISVTFLNATEFLTFYTGKVLTRFVAIITVQESTNKAEQIIKKKVYDIDTDGYCYVEEQLYTGIGEELEEGRIERTKTLFTRIPAAVILNEGLTNDTRGESEIGILSTYEGEYNKLANADMDSERKSMNPITYAIDASDNSTKGLSSSPGSFWDIQSNQNGSDPKNASVGMMEAHMSYSPALKVTLDRIETAMFSQVEVPNLDSEKLQGLVTSGKTLKALYWGLTVRCNEKMLVWGPALTYIAEVIIEGGKLYPESARLMSDSEVPDMPYEVVVENNYPLPDDEIEEKTMDLAEVGSETMSKMSYMKKWRGLTDDECEAELQQIAKEKQLLESSWAPGGSEEVIGLSE